MINRYRRAARQVNELKLGELDPRDAALAGVVARPAEVVASPTPEQPPTSQHEVGQLVAKSCAEQLEEEG